MDFLPVENIEMPSMNTEVWRYIDIQKYLHLITSGGIWFPCIDKFEDPWEGEQTIKDDDDFRETSRKHGIHPSITEFSVKSLCDKRFFTASCWHASEYESAALWKIFEPKGSVLAIKSTIKKLSESLESPNNSIFCGKIKYIDYDRDQIGVGNVFQKFFHKRKSFSFENEVRLARLTVSNPSAKDATPIPDQISKISSLGGVNVKVDLQNLITEIVVSPRVESWAYNSIVELSKRLGISQSLVRHSSLYTAK